MVPFTPICQIITKIDEISDPNKIFDFRNIFFFFNKPLQNLGSICKIVTDTLTLEFKPHVSLPRAPIGSSHQWWEQVQ